MVMEKTSPLLVGREFVRQYYTVLNKAPDFLHRFYGRNSSYVHGGLDSNGKLAEAVYGQTEIHKKVMSLHFSECHTKIRHVDAHATLGDGVVVQVMGELSNSGQPMRRFLQTFVLAPEGSVDNKFYVHNDIFRYEDEVFGDSEAELEEESEVEEEEEPHVSPEAQHTTTHASNCYEPHPVSTTVDQVMEDPAADVEPESEPEARVEELKEDVPEKIPEELKEKSPSPTPVETAPQMQEPPKTFSWASVTSKNLPLSGSGPSSGIPPHVVKVTTSQPRAEVRSEASAVPLRPRDQRVRDRPALSSRGPRTGRAESEAGEVDRGRMVRYPDNHQLFVGNLPHDISERELCDFFMTYGNVVELRINTKGVGGKLPNFGFVVFDDSEPVQRILGARPIMFRGEVRLNVEEKKTRLVREREARSGASDDRRDSRRMDRGPSGPRGIMGSGGMRDRDNRAPPPRGGMAPRSGPGPARGPARGPAQAETRFSEKRR
uniref:GTPase activating protein (SH3 domain) binding protein 2 n=1 Tax=Electrophorus electricus TaxID=8005 RepID=A0A4W4HHD4_ELEEL